MESSFFDEQSDASLVKSTIVSKYFWAWAKVVMRTAKTHGNRIAYIDLFAGPGRYKDGSKSTPIRVLEEAIADPDMRRMLVTIFNDANSDSSFSLDAAIKDIPGVDKLKHKPVVKNFAVGEDIVKLFETMHLVPTLFFVDPWGYKGLSLRLVNSVLKDWGCDCIFFFNYLRANMGLPNESVRDHMNALFGADRADSLRDRLQPLEPTAREFAIVEELASALKELGGRYVLPFRFRNGSGARTSHYLIFVSKHVLGYEIMKGIMAKESTGHEEGVASFEYSPVTDQQLRLLFALSRPLDALGGSLQERFAGQRLTMEKVYESHHVDTPYIKKNYKDALIRHEELGRVVVEPAAANRRKNTLADRCLVTFPVSGG